MGSKRQESLGKEIAHYFSSMLLKQIIGLLVAVLRPKFLTPEQFGLFSLLKIIPNYASYVHLGSSTSARYSIPQMIAEGRKREIAAVEGSIFFGNLGANILFILFFIGISWPEAVSPEERTGILAIGMVILITWHNDFCVTLLKARQRFDLVGRTNYLAATATFATLPLVYFFEIYGLFVSMITSVLFVAAFLRAPTLVSPGFKFNWNTYVDLIRKGFPIMALGVVLMFIRTTDRLIISGFMGNEQLGYYGVGAMIFNLLMQLPTVSREVIEPRLMQSLSSKTASENLQEFLIRPLINTAYLMPFLVGGAFFGSPIVISWLLPKYAAGIPATQILMTGSFFLGLCYITRGIIVAQNWQLAALRPAGIVLVVNVLLCATAAYAGFGIEGVAISSTISLALLFSLLLRFIQQQAGYKAANWTRLIFLLALPATLMYLLLVSYRMLAGSQWSSLSANALGLVVYMPIVALVTLLAISRFPELEGLRFWKKHSES
ncbi:oligosaccharide flippase family protein [Maridesulfovibrio frigidus]|uniref:oligosaccharide flippase family protein n=1 Tax=Maridesulfovibrio frigidus TaxID=340956 RepID=UPI0004E16B55|nr:oligosaccharide flippase family protein [Maridesulfovibrio frigidus]